MTVRFELSTRGWQVGLADLLFIFFTCTIMQSATMRMMDDPGLGWHLRYADQMIEQGGFVYTEPFCYPARGQRVVQRAWLSDLVLRAAYGWGGLNAMAILTCLVLAVTLRCIYRRLTSDGAHWSLAALATYLAAMGMVPSYVARPNVVSFLGVWLVADLCQRHHAGRLNHRQLFWLVPIMLLWANLHGGFLAGLVLLAVACVVELAGGFLAPKSSDRSAARARLPWLIAAVSAAAVATLANPNGIGLHLWSFSAATDPFIQTQTTREWLPPDFGEAGWFNIERLMLLLPLLAVGCRRRINLVGLAMTVVWLHFALTSRRYSTLWVVIAIPTLCELARHNRWLHRTANRFQAALSDDLRSALFSASSSDRPVVRSGWAISCSFAVLALLISPALPTLAAHHEANLPAASLERFFELHNGERTFHSINWGGYLTWHGWNRPQRFETWIDDRIDVHGVAHTKRYFQVMRAEPGWQDVLDETGVDMICVPPTARLVDQLNGMDRIWQSLFANEHLTIFRRQQPAFENVAQDH